MKIQSMLATALAGMAVALACTTSATSAVKTEEITYQAGDTPLKGLLAWNDAAKGKRPGVLVVHEWWGLNENTRSKAKDLAKAGYVAFALDMYGNGRNTSHPDSAEAFMQEALKDQAAMGARFDAALARLKEDPHVIPTRSRRSATASAAPW
jgi:dienelactone hydrolase